MHSVLGQEPPKINAPSSMSLRQRLVLVSWRLLTYPDAARGWYRHAANKISELLAKDRYDAVLSTSPPVTAHIAVAKSLRSKTPWLADLRDLWAGNPYYPGRLRYFLDKTLESRVLSKASALTTISEPLAAVLARNHPDKPTFSVLNAFDPAEWENVPFVSPKKCTLTYAGQMRDPGMIFRALARELAAGNLDASTFELNLYTAPVPWLASEITQNGLDGVVKICGLVPRDEVLRAERASSANVILLSFLQGEEAAYTGKLFEYLGARRPIAAFGPLGSIVGDLLKERDAGWYASSVDEARSTLRAIYNAWHTNPDRVLSPETIEQYAARHLAKRFSEILNQIV
jgi:hypothetical protein